MFEGSDCLDGMDTIFPISNFSESTNYAVFQSKKMTFLWLINDVRFEKTILIFLIISLLVTR